MKITLFRSFSGSIPVARFFDICSPQLDQEQLATSSRRTGTLAISKGGERRAKQKAATR
jgi:hypothetical protein